MTIIEKLEQATGPDRSLDVAIAEAIGWKPKKNWDGTNWLEPAGVPGAWNLLRQFTSSLDAIIPGEDIVGTSEQKQREGEPIKWVAIHRMPKGRMTVSATARTEAIARRAAALKARGVNSKLTP